MAVSLYGSMVVWAAPMKEVPDTTYLIREVTVAQQATEARNVASSIAPVQRIGAAEMQALATHNVADAVKLMSGVSVRDYGGLGGMKTVSVRNLGAAHTAVCYDGVPVSNCLSGQIDLSRFGCGHLSEVRLCIGQVDDLLAPAILAGYSGTLLLATPQALASRTEARGEASYADWSTYEASASVTVPLVVTTEGCVAQQFSLRGVLRGTDGNYPYTLTNGNLVTRERRENSRVHGGQAEAEWNVCPGNRTRIDTKVYYYRSHNQLPGNIIYYNTFSREELREENFLAQTRLSSRWGRCWRTQAVVKYSHAWSLHTDPDLLPQWQREVYRQDELYMQGGIAYQPDRRWTVALVEDLQQATLRSSLPDCPFPVRRSSYTDVRLAFRLPRLEVRGSMLYTAVRDSAASDHDFFTPSISASIKLLDSEDLYLRATARRGYRLPSFNDLYYYRIGNRDLRPERTSEYNAGLTFRRGDVTLTADGYVQDVRDKIVAFPTTFAWKMVNFERAHLYGVDATAAWRHTFRADWVLALNAGYMYQRAEDRTEQTRGSQLPYTPRHSGNGTAVLTWCGTSVGYAVQWMGRRYSNRMNTWRYRLDPYADQSLTLSHLFGSRWTLYASVQNLANRQYEVVQYYPMPGRMWRVGVRFAT